MTILKDSMEKELIVLVLFLVLLSGCAKVQKEETQKLDDLQTTACEEADKAGTCQTRLIDVGIVMPDECCEAIGKCCGT